MSFFRPLHQSPAFTVNYGVNLDPVDTRKKFRIPAFAVLQAGDSPRFFFLRLVHLAAESTFTRLAMVSV